MKQPSCFTTWAKASGDPLSLNCPRKRRCTSGAYRWAQRQMVVWSMTKPRSIISSSTSRRISENWRYHGTHVTQQTAVCGTTFPDPGSPRYLTLDPESPSCNIFPPMALKGELPVNLATQLAAFPQRVPRRRIAGSNRRTGMPCVEPGASCPGGCAAFFQRPFPAGLAAQWLSIGTASLSTLGYERDPKPAGH